MSETEDSIFPSEYVAAGKAQAAALKPQASEHGLRFDGYFVPDVATWVLSHVENGDFHAPSDAVFVAMQVFMELQDYPDLREELLRRELQKALDDPRPSIPGDEALARIMDRVKRRGELTPAVWTKIPFPE
jgi:antitoxin ParD1/3/4